MISLAAYATCALRLTTIASEYCTAARHFTVGAEHLHSRPEKSAVIFNVSVITVRVTERENNEGFPYSQVYILTVSRLTRSLARVSRYRGDR